MKIHPSAQARFKKLGERFLKLRQEHQRTSDTLWAGTIAREFTDKDLEILADYLSLNDNRLLRQMRQPTECLTNVNTPKILKLLK